MSNLNMSHKEEIYLWEFPRNLCCPPCKVRVIKECPKTYWLDRLCGKKVHKVQNLQESKVYHQVGYNDYCLYYLTEEEAISNYNRLKEKEEESILHSSTAYIKRKAVEEFAEKAGRLIHEHLDSETDYTPSMICHDIFDRLIEEIYGGDNNG